MAEQGWIKLHRCIRSNWIWNDKPFSRGQAFLDLLLMVNHEDKKIIFNGSLTEVKRGGCITSIRKLGDKWGWSNKKVKMFLDQLQSDKMITYESNTKRTLVTIEKYDLYQSKETPKEQQSTTKETQKHNRSITEAYQKHTNKNDKEYIKNDKEGKEREEVSSLPPLSYPTPIHKLAFDNFGEVSYRTWIDGADIKEDGELIIITVEAFKKQIVQDRYGPQIALLTGKKVSVKVGEQNG
ncbi:MAG: hypothetical protein E6X82_03980 [Clostridium sp.]|nr:hypothetical protein [Escherichia coli]MDU4787641.1 hypothetical protein [Clostridium sp.]